MGLAIQMTTTSLKGQKGKLEAQLNQKQREDA
ncbi:hypothetical protein PI124_g10857 [Phytophthora idaei]|nr:hypothetical protein PI125_g10427 [Phytophthora idaei]KAG3138233.1 hypothetical protein PI126_g17017 [Phytophthora idaei]KAG3244366.1 hypothetical protein PI124_g10857 [Phytophthora idaei]